MGKKASVNNMVGRTLMKARENMPSAKRKKNKLDAIKDSECDVNNVVEESEDSKKSSKDLFSVTEQNDLEEFLAKAQLAGVEFTAQRMNVSVVEAGPNRLVGVATERDEQRMKEAQEKYKNYLTVPRRPVWSRQMNAEQLHEMENENFLQWRRKLAELEENEQLYLTPFERNIEIWRQLWRVVDKSDVIVQILDARDPLLFRNEDLEQYVQEVSSSNRRTKSIDSNLHKKIDNDDDVIDNRSSKLNVLLMNKADYLTERQRQIWCNYFNKQNIRAVFWSATDLEDENATNVSKITIKEEKCEDDGEIVESDEDDFDDCKSNDEDSQYETVEEGEGEVENMDKPLNSSRLLTREELLEYLEGLRQHFDEFQGDVFTIGMVGYPNVGKSSTINKLIQRKKVAVSATPGKTKHFQTLFLHDELMLCDCPGLVMPSFAMSKQQMVLSGILSADQMREYETPVALMCQKVPRRIFQLVYGLTFPRKEDHVDTTLCDDPRELMTLYAFSRGFMSPKGLPDCSRAARALVKDFVNGKLRYSHAPPTCNQTDFDDWSTVTSSGAVCTEGGVVCTRQGGSEVLRTLQKRHLVNDEGGTSGDVDKAFFGAKNSTMHVQAATAKLVGLAGGSKPPKKTNRNKKRDKLRRVYRDLDA